MRRISRRDFLKVAVVGGVGVTTLPNLIGRGYSETSSVSRIALVEDPGFSSNMKLNPEPLRQAVDSLLKKLTGKDTVWEAWKDILKGYRKGQVIGIKVNCINRRLPSHPELVDALVQSLVEFGVPENDIVIYDRTNNELKRSGYKLNRGQNGVRCFGTDSPGWGYDADNPIEIEGQEKHLTKILTRLCDHLINVPVLKDHNLAGVTLSMKNHYGTVDNPSSLHGNNCDPFIAKLNAASPIKDKTRLIILDAILGIYRGGPGGAPQFSPNMLAAAFDPVAMDRFGMDLINRERRKRGLDEVTGRAKHVHTAAILGLGTDDESKIKIVRV
ncbi:TPA: DUF362 domain-containing protein [Candidatus Poribacteria bacterium]|nr:DUF362 domain-containing protein [Candidatus Poribacteria bacterium]